MSNFFENIKNYLFKQKKKEKANDNNLKKPRKQSQENQQKEKQEDETSILIEEENRQNVDMHLYNNKKIFSKSLIQNRLLPLLYFTFSLSKIIVCFLSEPMEGNKENYITIDPSKGVKMFDFFKLYNVNPLVFHVFNLITGLIGIFIIYLVQNTLLIKFLGHTKSNTLMQFLQIYLTSFFGLFSQILHIVSGMLFFHSTFPKIDNYTKAELKISIHQLLFFMEIFFTSIYGIFICVLIIKVNKNDLLENDKDKDGTTFLESFNYNYENIDDDNYNENHNNNNANTAQKIITIPENISSKWLNYIIISLIYLIFFSISYILLFLFKNKNIVSAINNININANNINKINNVNINNFDIDYFKLNQNYLMILLPYLIYVLHCLFFASFYGVLKYSSTCHIEFTSENVYDKSQKNML
jgi:hypothetical protein